MPKSILLLLCVLPLIGTPQSAKKLNKQLRAAYVVKYHNADSVKQLYDKELALWKSTKSAFYDTIEHFRALDKKYYSALGDSLSHKRVDLERLGVEQVNGVDHQLAYTLQRNIQSCEFIFSPFFDRLHFLEVVLGVAVSLDSISDLDVYDRDFQNKQLQWELEEIDRFFVAAAYDRNLIAENLLKMDAAQTQLTALKQTLKEMVPVLRVHNTLLEKEWNAKKQLFAKNGPKGFDEVYFEIFPDVFPKPKQELVEPIRNDVEPAYDGEFIEEVVAAPFSEDVIYVTVDEVAEYPGGISKLKEFVEANIHYPATAIELGIQGKCYLQFIVRASGKISNIEVIRGVPDCEECDKEAIRLVQSMPDWIPAKIKGKSVSTTFNMPVSFKLNYK